MRLAPMHKTTAVKFNDTDFQVDSRVLNLFKKKAGDKLQQCWVLTNYLVSQGKSVERALADSLEQYRLI